MCIQAKEGRTDGAKNEKEDEELSVIGSEVREQRHG